MVVYNGGDPTGRVDHLRWSAWGRPRAVGRGVGWVPIGSVADGQHAPAELIATNLGTCRGKPAYRTIQFWFPTLKKFRRGARYDICTPYPK